MSKSFKAFHAMEELEKLVAPVDRLGQGALVGGSLCLYTQGTLCGVYNLTIACMSPHISYFKPHDLPSCRGSHQ